MKDYRHKKVIKNTIQVPADFFSSSANIITFSISFGSYKNLVTVPSNLFRDSILVTNFNLGRL